MRVRKTEFTDWGLFTEEDIPADTFIIEYKGEFIKRAEFKKRFEKNGEKNVYFLSVSKEVYIDAKKYGNESRFANHSCQPNTTAEKWTIHSNGREYTGIGLFAKHKINKVSNIELISIIPKTKCFKIF